MTEAREKTLELLTDIERACRGLLLNEYGIPTPAVTTNVYPDQPGLVVQLKQESLPLSLRYTPGAITEVMVQVCKSLRAVLDQRLPSLSHSLGMQYLPDQMKIEIGVGPDANPLYPHIVTGTVRELRLTEAGRLAVAKGILEL